MINNRVRQSEHGMFTNYLIVISGDQTTITMRLYLQMKSVLSEKSLSGSIGRIIVSPTR